MLCLEDKYVITIIGTGIITIMQLGKLKIMTDNKNKN